MVPNTLTIDQLAELGHGSLHQIARQAVGTLTTYRVILGRCLVAVARTQAYLEYGCSGVVHYATSVLGLEDWLARQLMRVATQLEELPRFRLCAENGQVSWSKMREVLRVVLPETEEFWLEVCRLHPYVEVERLVRRAQAGGDPHEEGGPGGAEVTELRLNLSADSMRVIERAVRAISQEAGRALPPALALEYLCADYLARQPMDWEEKLESAREEARRDRAAERENLAALEGSARNISGWSLANASCEVPCPGNSEVSLVRPDRPHWENDRLRFNPGERLPTPAQKAELMRRDGYRCKTPGCPNHLFLQAHHITFFSEDGKTLPDNLVILCSACHRNVHEGRLRIEGRAPHQLRFLDASGRDLAVQCQLSLAGWLDFFVGWEGGELDSHGARVQNGVLFSWGIVPEISVAGAKGFG